VATQRWTIPNITLITPMLGGGVEPMTPDLECPVRPSEIRGQLRFWWRAMQDVETPEELFRKEAELWGGMGRKSAVTVRVGDLRGYATEPAPTGFRDKLGYVYFAAREGRRSLVKEGLSFSLRVQCPADRTAEVQETIALWSLLGGLGARTRRGSGAVKLDFSSIEVPIRNANELAAWINQALPRSATVHPWPTVRGPGSMQTLRLSKLTNPRQAWEAWIDGYKQFRQMRPKGREGRPGRSYWPEPDSLRVIHQGHSRDHAPRDPQLVSFPRGAYGLPIVFHFKDRGDPSPDYILQIDRTADRWTSPVILKVASLPDGKILRICWVLSSAMPHSFYVAKGPKARALTTAESPCGGAWLSRGEALAKRVKGPNPYRALRDWMDQVNEPSAGAPGGGRTSSGSRSYRP